MVVPTTAAMFTLYHSWLSPGSRMVRIVLAEKRQEVALRLEKDWERREDFLRLNPAGDVPVLVTPSGKPLANTMAICEFLEASIAEPSLFTGTAMGDYEVRRLCGWFMGKFQQEVTRNLVSEKLMKRFLKMGEPNADAIRTGLFNLRNHLDYMTFLVDRRHYLAGDHFSLADAAAAAHLSIVDYFGDVDWADRTLLKEWYMRVKSRRSLRGILSDRIPGLTPPKYYEKPDF